MAVVTGTPTSSSTAAERRRVGTRGDDVLDGHDGRDLIYGGLGNDVLRGGRGDDRLYGEAGDDRLEGGPGDDLLDGGLGFDLASFAGSAAAVMVDLRAGTAFGEGADRLARIEGVEGSAFDDYVGGNSLANRFMGGAGNDTLSGGGGSDTLDGGLGDDVLRGGDGDDRIVGGEGRDTASYAGATAGVSVVAGPGVAMAATGGAGRDELTGIEVVEGSRFGDSMAGHVSAAAAGAEPVDQVFRGMAGDDHLAGGAGNDVLEGGIDDDVLCGDYAPGGQGGDDTLYGGSGQDRLILDEGGRDLHVGGFGRDVFELYHDSGAALSGADVIADFTAGEDLLRLVLDDGAGGSLDGAGLVALLDQGGDGRLGAADAGGPKGAAGWSVSVADITLGDATAASLLIEAAPGSAASADGYVLCLFGVTELGGADVI